MNNTIICSTCEIVDDYVVLIPNRPIKTVSNTGDYRLVIACNINTPESNYPLAIQIGDNYAPVLCKYGNELLANQVNKRVNYPIGYGDQNDNYMNGQFVILSCRCLNPRGIETTV